MDDGAVATGGLEIETWPERAAGVAVEATPTEPASEVIVPAPGVYDFIYTFWDGDPYLALGSLDGVTTPIRRLAGGVSVAGQAALSPKGDRIAYLTFDATVSDWDLRVLSLRDLSDRHIIHVVGPAGRPAWSPDGKTLAYVSFTRTFTYGVHVIPAAGGSARLLDEVEVGSAEQAHFIAPHWSPSGTEVVYGALYEGIRAFHLGRGTFRTLVNPQGERIFAEPRWSPSGDAVAYAWYDPSDLGEGGIARVSKRGGTPVDLAPAFGGLGFGRVRWSPCGDAIVYADFDYDTTSAAIRRVDADGSNLMILDHTDSGLGDGAGQPEWSPDGELILYARYDRRISDAALNTIDATGGPRQALGIEGAAFDKTYASWFPSPLVVR